MYGHPSIFYLTRLGSKLFYHPSYVFYDGYLGMSNLLLCAVHNVYSLHLTSMCLQYAPTIVACVCIHLACKWSSFEVPIASFDIAASTRYFNVFHCENYHSVWAAGAVE